MTTTSVCRWATYKFDVSAILLNKRLDPLLSKHIGTLSNDKSDNLTGLVWCP